jgi:hypothetical protein
MLLDFPVGANTQHVILPALSCINLKTPPTKRANKLTKTLYSLLLVHPLLNSRTLKFLITNPTAFLERSILEKLIEVDAITQTIIAEFLCKWVTVDKLFYQHSKKWHKLLVSHQHTVQAFNQRTLKKGFKYKTMSFEETSNILTNCKNFT